MNSSTSRFLFGAALAALLLSAAKATPSATDSTLVPPCPVSSAVVRPTLIPCHYLNATVKVTLTIDEHGVPSHIRVNDGRDAALNRSLVTAISQWRFKPATKNGIPVKRRAVMPLTLVEEG